MKNVPVVITLSEEERNKALRYQERILKKISGYGKNYTGLETVDRYFVGKCGEIAICKWAANVGLDCEDTTTDDGTPDKQDVIFTKTAITVNIKNSHHPMARKLMHPIECRKRHYAQLLVGANGHDFGKSVVVYLWGAVSNEYFDIHATKEFNAVAPCLSMKLAYLPLNMRSLNKYLNDPTAYLNPSLEDRI